ncbi:phosphoserine phosphatase RsbU [Methyloglobulus morosus KoM1]|uniref:Phosphoserine phosphatase RsbU n=1 Tax=Methyloglobulus morosus KoM1 TaxID=1116472 RepID=V5C164_9GAMM|nr:PAS domain S-box protein [Methyloglobulus morosus]ESS73834.1 phosphoserine phosphatase RsbU [Methyloglobulus morosus KoM1]
MHHIIDSLSFNMVIVRINHSDKVDNIPRIHQVNCSTESLLGYSENELVGKPLALIFATDKVMDLWQSAVAKMDDLTADNCFEGEIVSKGRHKIHVLLSISPLPNQHPKHTDIFLLIQAIEPDNDLFRMHRVVEQSASAMLITDRAGRIEYANPKFAELTGYTTQELLGQNPRMLQTGNTPSEFDQNMWQMLLSTGEWRGEFQGRKKNGELYWVYESISGIKNSAGDITHFVAVEEDITRRKEAESALAESEERFRQMAEMTGEWLWEQDPEGYYLYCSNAVAQILGFSRDQIIGRQYTEFLTAQDQKSQRTYATSHKPFYGLINHYQHRDGQQILTESTGLPIFNAQGKLLKWRGVDHDITARMHFQEALIESEKRTRLIIESSMNAIILMDSYGIVTDWNHRAEKMFGWSSEEAIGRRLDELIIPPRFHKAHRDGLKTFLQTGVGPMLNKQSEQVALRRDGTEFPVELSVSPLKFGNTYIFSGFMHDISNRKAAEEQIRQAQVNLAIAQNEIKIAQQIQATLSPSAPIKSEDFELAGFCLPADKVGGDYFDYFFRKEGQLDIVIADVSGHSIGPALFMVEARSAIRAQTNLLATPSETLVVLNNFLFDDLDKSDYFITLFYLQYNIHTQQLRFANAGHPPPLLLNQYEGEFKKLDAEGLLLGVRKNVVFEEKTTMLEKGDVILFYTDGLIEVENTSKEFFGLDRVKAIVSQNAQEQPQAIIDEIFVSLRQFSQSNAFADDITLMVLKCH